MPAFVWEGETKTVPFRVRGFNPATGGEIDPTSSTLTVGFVRRYPDGLKRQPATFFAAVWTANQQDGSFWGSVTVGPAGVTILQPGPWTLWARFTLGAETILQPVEDTLVVR